MRRFLMLCALFAVTAPGAVADEAAGRYGIAPAPDGFTRLDTATGVITHCGVKDGAWACDRLTENPTDVERRLDALADTVRHLSEGLSELSARVTALDGGPDAEPAREIEEPPAGERLTVAHEAMRRFLEVVRTLKRGAA